MRLYKIMKRKYLSGIICGLFLWGVYAILLMIRTQSIIRNFGSEINSINQSAQTIFSYFILFESGMGAAYLFKMYEPMAVHDMGKISSLYAGLTISMRKIAMKMFLAILPASVIYAAVMNRQDIGYFIAFLTILLVGIRFVIPYYISVNKKTLLTLYEYKYFVDIVDSLGNILTVLLELWLLHMVQISIVFILCIGCVVNILVGLFYKYLTERFCEKVTKIKTTPNFEAEGMTKAILIHQLAGLLNSNVDTILLSIVNIYAVTVYQAYTMICTYPVQLINKISEIFRANFGVRMVNNDKRLYKDFQRLLSFHMFVSVIAIAVFITCINPFIDLWIGSEFTVSRNCVYLFALYMVHRMTFNAVYIVRDSQGLYEESKIFSIKEAIFNLILSIVLVKPFGIGGVMAATVISVYLGLVPGNAKLVFVKIFHKNNRIFLDYFMIIIAVVFSIAAYYLLWGEDNILGWKELVLSAILQALVATAFAGAILGIYKGKYLFN